MKLYRVTLRGMTDTSMGTQVAHGAPYVVAESMDQAYGMVRAELDRKRTGFSKEREIEKCELLAEEGEYPDCLIPLYLADKERRAGVSVSREEAIRIARENRNRIDAAMKAEVERDAREKTGIGDEKEHG